jgi:hypothetical protein
VADSSLQLCSELLNLSFDTVPVPAKNSKTGKLKTARFYRKLTIQGSSANSFDADRTDI